MFSLIFIQLIETVRQVRKNLGSRFHMCNKLLLKTAAVGEITDLLPQCFYELQYSKLSIFDT